MEKWEKDYAEMVKNIESVKKIVGPRSMLMAINRLASTARGTSAKKVASERQVPLFLVRRRMYARNANMRTLTSINKAYIKDIPFIALGENARSGEQKGAFTYRSDGDIGPGFGGVKIKNPIKLVDGKRKTSYRKVADGFVNVIRKNQKVHVMRRMQRATWSGGKRLPVEVLKLKVDSSFQRHFRPTFIAIVNKNYEKEFHAAFRKNLAKRLAK